MNAKEEVIHDNICGIRKQVIHLQLEIKFAKQYIEKNHAELNDETINGLNSVVQTMEKEVELSLQKLKFYQEERDTLINKKTMREYRKFPKTISMSQLSEIKE